MAPCIFVQCGARGVTSSKEWPIFVNDIFWYLLTSTFRQLNGIRIQSTMAALPTRILPLSPINNPQATNHEENIAVDSFPSFHSGIHLCHWRRCFGTSGCSYSCREIFSRNQGSFVGSIAHVWWTSPVRWHGRWIYSGSRLCGLYRRIPVCQTIVGLWFTQSWTVFTGCLGQAQG